MRFISHSLWYFHFVHSFCSVHSISLFHHWHQTNGKTSIFYCLVQNCCRVPRIFDESLWDKVSLYTETTTTTKIPFILFKCLWVAFICCATMKEKKKWNVGHTFILKIKCRHEDRVMNWWWNCWHDTQRSFQMMFIKTIWFIKIKQKILFTHLSHLVWWYLSPVSIMWGNRYWLNLISY